MDIPNCIDCGKCCCSNDPTWIEVSEKDAETINKDLLQAGDIEPYAMKMVDGKCICLLDNKCTIYPDRPTICRVFKRGSIACFKCL